MVELRLDPVDNGAMPNDCYISVRVGETQKLSKISASRLYRFPQAGERRYGKIEVFRRIGYCSIDVDPLNEGMREVSISCQEAGFGTLGLKVAVKPEGNEKENIAGEGAAKGEKKGANHKVKAAKEYLAKHSLEVRLSEAMQAVLKERPDDPAEFMAQKLLGHSPTSGGTKLPPVARSLPEEKTKPMPASKLLAEENMAPVPPSSMKKGPPRPHKLDPLQKEAAPEKAAEPAAAPAPQKPLEDFAGFYAANFRPFRGPVLDGLYSKFPRAEAKAASPAPAPVQPSASPAREGFQMKPSVGTWLQAPPAKPKTGPAPPGRSVADMKRMPSVGTWIKPLPRRMQALVEPPREAAPAPAPTPAPAAAFVHRPSVGTWLAAPSPMKPPKVSFAKKPSVGTWLVRLPEPEPEPKVPAASPQPAPAPAPAGPAFVRKPSVGTWLARPTPARKTLPAAAAPSAAAAFMRKPSVGTWLAQPRRRSRTAAPAPAPAPAQAAPARAATFARMPSVGTWLQMPSPVAPPKVPYQRKPSVGTWLARLPEP